MARVELRDSALFAPAQAVNVKLTLATRGVNYAGGSLASCSNAVLALVLIEKRSLNGE